MFRLTLATSTDKFTLLFQEPRRMAHLLCPGETAEQLCDFCDFMTHATSKCYRETFLTVSALPEGTRLNQSVGGFCLSVCFVH